MRFRLSEIIKSESYLRMESNKHLTERWPAWSQDLKQLLRKIIQRFLHRGSPPLIAAIIGSYFDSFDRLFSQMLKRFAHFHAKRQFCIRHILEWNAWYSHSTVHVPLYAVTSEYDSSCFKEPDLINLLGSYLGKMITNKHYRTHTTAFKL